ncbi:hypothetical protein WMO79_04645 [Micrococcaceae bacterium Sec7.4]
MTQSHDLALPASYCDDVRQGLPDAEHLTGALEWTDGEEERLTWQK